MSEPHQIVPDDSRSWLDLYRENQQLREALEEKKARVEELEAAFRKAFHSVANASQTNPGDENY